MTSTTRFFIKSVRGIALGERFFCGEIIKAKPEDVYPKTWLCPGNTYAEIEEDGLMKSFDTWKDATHYSGCEYELLVEANDYAREAMDNEGY